MKGKHRVRYFEHAGYKLSIEIFKKILKTFFCDQAIYFLRLPYSLKYSIHSYKSTLTEVIIAYIFFSICMYFFLHRYYVTLTFFNFIQFGKTLTFFSTYEIIKVWNILTFINATFRFVIGSSSADFQKSPQPWCFTYHKNHQSAFLWHFHSIEARTQRPILPSTISLLSTIFCLIRSLNTPKILMMPLPSSMTFIII